MAHGAWIVPALSPECASPSFSLLNDRRAFARGDSGSLLCRRKSQMDISLRTWRTRFLGTRRDTKFECSCLTKCNLGKVDTTCQTNFLIALKGERLSNVSRRDILQTLCLLVGTLIHIPEATAAAVKEADGYTTVSETDARGEKITYEFRIPSPWKKQQVFPKRASAVFLYVESSSKDAIALGIDDKAGAKTLADLGTPDKAVRKLAKTLLKPPVNEGDESSEVRVVSAKVVKQGGRDFLVAEAVFAENLYTELGRPYISERHIVSKLTLHEGRLYAVTASCSEKRWKTARSQLEDLRDSFIIQ